MNLHVKSITWINCFVHNELWARACGTTSWWRWRRRRQCGKSTAANSFGEFECLLFLSIYQLNKRQIKEKTRESPCAHRKGRHEKKETKHRFAYEFCQLILCKFVVLPFISAWFSLAELANEFIAIHINSSLAFVDRRRQRSQKKWVFSLSFVRSQN